MTACALTSRASARAAGAADACAEQHRGEPEAPFCVHFALAVSAADRDVWGEAAATLNVPAFATTGEYLFFVASGSAGDVCGVEIREGDDLAIDPGGCVR